MEYSVLTTALAVFQIVVCVVALWAFIVWNKGRHLARTAGFAEEVLQAMYRARAAFAWARFPSVGEHEGKTRVAKDDEEDHEKEYRDKLYVPIERLHDEAALFSDLYVMRYRFASLFGANSTGAFQEIESIRQEIIAAANNLLKDHENPLYEDKDEGIDFVSGAQFSEDPILHADSTDFAMVDRGVHNVNRQEYTTMKNEWYRTIFGPDRRKRKKVQYEGPDRRKNGTKEPSPEDAQGWFERTNSNEDPIKKRIDAAIESIEEVCSPYLMHSNSSFY